RIPADKAQDERQEDAQERGRDPDEERDAAAVEDAHRKVAAVRVGAEHVAAAQARPDGRAVEADDRDAVAALVDVALDVLVVRPVVAGEIDEQRREREADQEDGDQDRRRDDRGRITPQPPPRQPEAAPPPWYGDGLDRHAPSVVTARATSTGTARSRCR